MRMRVFQYVQDETKMKRNDERRNRTGQERTQIQVQGSCKIRAATNLGVASSDIGRNAAWISGQTASRITAGLPLANKGYV
jgi:hypothetical protein